MYKRAAGTVSGHRRHLLPVRSGCPACSRGPGLLRDTWASEWHRFPCPSSSTRGTCPWAWAAPPGRRRASLPLQWHSEVPLGGNTLPLDIKALNQQTPAFRDQKQNICPRAPGSTACARTAGPEPRPARSWRTGGRAGWAVVCFGVGAVTDTGLLKESGDGRFKDRLTCC